MSVCKRCLCWPAGMCKSELHVPGTPLFRCCSRDVPWLLGIDSDCAVVHVSGGSTTALLHGLFVSAHA